MCLHSSDHDAISADPELAAAIIEPLTEHNLLRKIETELEVPSECGSHDRVVVSSMERLLQAEMFHIRHALFIADDAVADHLLKSGAAGAGVEVFTKDQFIREFVPGCGDGDEEE